MNLRTESFKEEILSALWAIVAIEAFRGGYMVLGTAASLLFTASIVGSIYYAYMAKKAKKEVK